MTITTTRTVTENEHERAWNLLPWYINRSLDSTEQTQVKNHIRSCVACRIELRQQQQLFDKIQQTELLQQVSQVSFAKLKNQIKAVPKPTTPADHKKYRKLPTASMHHCSGAMKYAALAASLFLLASVLIFESPVDMPKLSGEYRTLANATESMPKNIARIAFVEDKLEPQQIEAILHGVSGHIVKGPSNNGIYEIQIGNYETSQPVLDDAILQLRNNALVIFAEFSQGQSSSD